MWKRKLVELPDSNDKTQKSGKANNNSVTAKFYEEGDVVEFEVEGQSTDFDSEMDAEDGEVHDSSDSEDEREIFVKSKNNNATKDSNNKQLGSCVKQRSNKHDGFTNCQYNDEQ